VSELSDKLRRQRRDPDRKEPLQPELPKAERQRGAPEWLRRQLSSSSRIASLSRAGQRANSESAKQVDASSAALKTVGEPADIVSVMTDLGELAFRELRYPDSHQHGEWLLSEIDYACRDALELLARDSACADLDLRKAIYLDIETTGLSGGAGTISFMVALGTFEAGEFRLWQGFLRSPAEEAALLFEIALRVADADAVVSFFGKSFDRHRLEDKMKLHGIEPPFDDKPHLDLYWPLQRLYGRSFGNGRLSTMETELTGVARQDDLPGSFAPEAWFDYLAGRAHRLEDVFRHNRDDVLSLVVLAAHAGRSLVGKRENGQGLSGPDGTRAAGLGRLFAAERKSERAIEWCDRAFEAGGVPEPSSLRLIRADSYLRMGDLERARSEWTALTDLKGVGSGCPEAAGTAALALAKLFEHRLRDLEAALAACAEIREIATGRLTGTARQRLLRGLNRREERLRAKRAK
jgi:uncharacterized protein YprB with RNaseH-like and TPR domain